MTRPVFQGKAISMMECGTYKIKASRFNFNLVLGQPVLVLVFFNM